MSATGGVPEPAFVCTYGRSGVGKSTDLLYSFPCGLFIAPPGALKPAVTVCGFEPRRTRDKNGNPTEAQTLMEVTAVLPRLADRAAKEGIDGVAIDDLSLLVERTVRHFEDQSKGSSNKWAMWGKVRNVLLDFRDAARRAGIHVLMNAHEVGPQTKENGQWVRGGPMLPGRGPDTFPPATDVCLRAISLSRDVTAVRRGWAGAYVCDIQDPDWNTKDRHGVIPNLSPMNVGEALRLAGYKLRRLPELDWQEEVVEKLSQLLLQATTRDQEGALLREASAQISTKYAKGNLPHVRWTIRDAYDRAYLRRQRANMLIDYVG